MGRRINYRSAGKLAAAAGAVVGIAGLGVGHSNGGVIVNGVLIDVRAMQLDGAPVADPKHVVVEAGDVVTFNVFAEVTGTNGLDDDGFQAINGAFRSSTGGLLGNLSAQLLAPFNGTGSQLGSTIDVDSDGDLDVSGPNPLLAGGYWNPRDPVGYATDGTRIGADTEEFLIGAATFTVGAAATGGQQTVVNYLQHRTTTGANNLAWGTFLIDGNGGGPSPRNPQNTIVGSDAGVLVEVVPEPASLALPAVGALGLLARRKRIA